MTSYKTWLYHLNEGGKIFDTETPEYDEQIASGEWFDSPAKCTLPPKKEEQPVKQGLDSPPVVDESPIIPTYSKFELSRVKTDERIEIGKLFGLDLSNVKREDQINAILEAQK